MRHTVSLYDRGGKEHIGDLPAATRVKWGRTRDDVSMADISIPTNADIGRISKVLDRLDAGRVELVVFRDGMRVWEGPVTRVTHRRDRVDVQARDVMHYVYRTIMRSEYDSRFPNVEKCTLRAERILHKELARKEALDPPINVRPYIRVYETDDDARTTSRTLRYEFTAFEHIDEMAARGGLDYTVVGRSIILFDVHTPLGQTPIVTEADFDGDLVITKYGMELATYAAMTDGYGNYGAAGGTDPHYGLVEILHSAYDENKTADDAPTSAEMESQAARTLAGRTPTPIVVRVPQNSTLNPKGVLSIGDLVPGVHIPVSIELPGQPRIAQMQKLDNVIVEETVEGEHIYVTLSPAPGTVVGEDDS